MSARREELDWLAFQYVTGELAPPERAEFDRLLATDLAAGEALADAVELLAATRHALTPPIAVRRPFVRWIGYAAAASVILWLALGARGPGARREEPRVVDPVDPQRAVALAWSQLRATGALSETDSNDSSSDDAIVMAEAENLVSTDEDADVELPAWLMTVSTLQPGPSKPKNPNGSG